MNFSAEQLKAIEAEGSDILVSASAGSGKTTVMIERVLRLIEKGTPLKRMLIVTFTKAAAADMKDKLMKKLTDRANKNSCFTAALKQLPQAEICTLHSFCQRLIRTYFYVLDVDPNFELLSDGDFTLLSESIERVIEESKSEEFGILYEVMLKNRKDAPLRNTIGKVYEFAVSMPDPIAWLDACLNNYGNDSAAKQIIESDLNKDKALLQSAALSLAVRTCQAHFKRNEAACQKLTGYLDGILSEDAVRVGGKIDPQFADLNDEFLSLKKKIAQHLKRRESVSRLRPAACALPVASALVQAVKSVILRYAEAKKKEGRLDYNDLEHFALDILKSETREAVTDSYDYVFVDEYQDINPLQDEILTRLKKENRLFMVGDLKQSIYSFRHCAPDIFAAKSKAFSTGGGLYVTLNDNYRTSKQIIDCVNAVFSEHMTLDFGGVDYKNTAMMKTSQTGGLKEPFDYRNVLKEKKEKPQLKDVYKISSCSETDDESDVRAQADLIVAEIVSCLDSYLEAEKRPATPSDIAVLMRSRGRLAYVLKERLAEMGVEAFVKGENQYAYLPETCALVNYLKLIDNPLDDIALASVLLSPYGGFTEDDLALVAEKKRVGEPFCKAVYADQKFSGFLKQLEGFILCKQTLQADELAGMIVSSHGAFESVLKMPEGLTRAKNLAAFLKLITDCGRNENLSDFLEFLELNCQSEDSAPLSAVKIMTVHMSKGLEFPFVIYADVNRQFNMADMRGAVMTDKTLGLAFKYPDFETHEFQSTFLTEAVSIVKRDRCLEEEQRIVYVAMTRAKYRLFIAGACRTDAERQLSRPKCPADFLSGLPVKNVKAGECIITESAVQSVPVFSSPDLSAAEEIEKRLKFPYKANRGQAQTSKAKTSVTELASADFLEGEGDYFGLVEHDDRALDTGNAYHLFMQLVDFNAPFERQWSDFLKTYPASAAFIAKEDVMKAHAVLREFVRGGKVYKEKAFVFGREDALVQGVIDLLLIKDCKAYIVDYKTTKSENLRTPQYISQVGIYAEAAENILGIKAEEKYIYSFYKGALVKI